MSAGPSPRTFFRLVIAAVVLMIAVSAAMFWYQISEIRREKAERARAARQVPDFALVDQRGETVRRADLSGSVWYVGFVDATSEGPDSAVVEAMRGIRSRTRTLQNVLPVLVTVRPERDDVGEMRVFARDHGLDDGWRCLTGEPARVAHLLRAGFGVEVGEAIGRVAMVDRQGRLRGVLDVAEPHFETQALTLIKHLRAER